MSFRSVMWLRPPHFLAATACFFVVGLVLFGSRVVFAPPALACVTNPNASNNHTTNGIYHGWDRVWSCDHWVYHGWTDHSHGTKYVQLYNYSTNAGKCSNFGFGSTNANCSSTATGDLIASFNDTGSSAQCDMFSDGHGICAHTMEPVT